MALPLPPDRIVSPAALAVSMRRRTFLKGMAGVGGALVLGACSNTGRGGSRAGTRTVRVPSWVGFGFPTPFTYVAGPGYWRESLIFDTLVWPDSTGNQLPWLASSYTRAPDGMSYTVELRDVKWNDGQPLRASDVVFTHAYYAERTFTPLLIGIPRNVAEVVPLDERTVQFKLAKPDATFLQYVLGTMPIVPEHIWSGVKDPEGVSDRKFVVGTGAYRLDRFDINLEVESYVANDSFFLGAPYLKRIEMVGAENSMTSLRVGDIDAGSAPEEGVRSEVLEPFRNNPEYGIIEQKGTWAFPLFFNLKRGGALADVRFRRACLHALNRDDMVQRLLTGNGEVGSQGFLSPQNPYYNPDVRQYPFDRAQAESLFEEAGYRRPRAGAYRTNPDGRPLRLTLFIPELVPVALAELIAANLKEAGIDIDLQRIDLVRLFGVKLQGGYDLLITSFPGPAGTGPSGDPELLRLVYYSNPNAAVTPAHNATGYNNPEVDRLLDAQLAAYDFEERKRLVWEIQQIVAEDLPVAVIYYPTLFFVFRRSVFDQWYYTPGGFGPGINTDAYNKQAYITGQKTGTEIRP